MMHPVKKKKKRIINDGFESFHVSFLHDKVIGKQIDTKILHSRKFCGALFKVCPLLFSHVKISLKRIKFHQEILSLFLYELLL